METVLLIVLFVLLIDVYIRIIQINRLRDFTAFQVDIINKILIDKGILDRESIDKARKETISKMPVENYNRLKKRLIKLGINIDA